MPANQSRTANPQSLTLPDVLTEIDLLAPAPDSSLLLSHPADLDLGADDSTLLQLENTPRSQSTVRFRAVSPSSVEIGRRAPVTEGNRDFEDTPRLYDDDLQLDLGDDPLLDGLDSSIIPGMKELNANRLGKHAGLSLLDDEGAIRMGDDVEMNDLDAGYVDNMDHNLIDHNSAAINTDDIAVQQERRAKRRKVLEADTDTQIHSKQIRAQQNDRSKILKPETHIPRDPVLLALLEMQKSGRFVSNVLGDGRTRGWAPELRGVLSLELITGSSEAKRKRKRELAWPGVDSELRTQTGDNSLTALQLNPITFPDDEVYPGGEESFASTSHLHNDLENEDENGVVVHDDNADFGHGEIPLAHAQREGPASVGTKHAVHLLREKLGNDTASGAGKRQQASTLFQELLPEETTTKADATKMFFEVLVLATKDAVKVEQPVDQLGGPLRLRGKRGLWGTWAESEAGGEIARQDLQITA